MKKWIWAIVIILVLLTAGMIVGFLLINRYWATSTDRIMWADWLAVACAILSLIGTIFLSCVAILQTDKANQMNDKLFKQNEKLQAMNDRQFQIANQDWYPLLFPESVITLRDREEKHTDLINKRLNEMGKNATFQMSRIWYCNDPTNKGISKKEFFVKLNLLLRNDSKSKIGRIKLYKIVSCEPYDDLLRDYNNVEREGVLFANDKFCLEIEINHHMQEFFQKSEQEYGLFFEIETITGVKFYQKMILKQWHFSDGEIDAEVKQISNQRIEK